MKCRSRATGWWAIAVAAAILAWERKWKCSGTPTIPSSSSATPASKKRAATPMLSPVFSLPRIRTRSNTPPQVTRAFSNFDSHNDREVSQGFAFSFLCIEERPKGNRSALISIAVAELAVKAGRNLREARPLWAIVHRVVAHCSATPMLQTAVRHSQSTHAQREFVSHFDRCGNDGGG